MAMISKNPATGETLKEFDEIADAELERRLQAAADAFTSFRETSFEQRATWMNRAADILESESRRLGELMTLEMGKPVGQAVAEAKKCAWVCRYYGENAASFLADEPVESNAEASWVKYQPLGPVLAVMPWNFPFWQLFRFAAPGLMAGNVGLLKHASNVPQCALEIEDIFRRAGFPEGAFQTLLIGAGRVEGVLDDPRIKAATLTGSEPAGRAVAQRAGQRIKKTVLELGGSDPFIVMPSADMDAALSTAVKARVQNNGQSCIAAKRFIVHAAIAEVFIERFVRAMEALSVGDPMDDATDVGPLATGAIRDELAEQVDASIAAGAHLLTGGRKLDRPGWFYAPTVLASIPDGAPAAREELFGPVASVFIVQDIDEAIARANDTDFGLGAAAWTGDAGERARFVDGIDAGCVFINSMVASDPRLPFGGIKRSGYGRELSIHGIREFVNIKTVSTM